MKHQKSGSLSMSKGDKFCSVCGDRALGCNFDAISCESCKAFFRRNALKQKVKICLYWVLLITVSDSFHCCDKATSFFESIISSTAFDDGGGHGMHSTACAIMRWLSVHPSADLSCLCIVPKWLNVSSIFFHLLVPPFLFFHIKHGKILTGQIQLEF